MATTESGPEILSDANSSEGDASTSDLSVKIDQLPEDQPVFLLDEARRAFRDHIPPFVVKKRSQRPRTCVIPTVNGTRPTYPTMIDVIPRLWDKNHVYWTIDVNYKRQIVTALPGGKLGGAKWVTWVGLGYGWKEKLVALSQFASNHPRPSTPTAESPSNKRRRHTESTLSSRSSDQENNDSRTTNVGSSDLSCSASEFTLRSFVNSHHKEKTSTKNALSKGKMPTRHSELPARISHDSYQGSDQNSKRRRLDISPREIKRLQALAPPPLSQPNRRTSRTQVPDSQTQPTITVVQPLASTATGLFSNLFNQTSPSLLPQPSPLPASNHTAPTPPNESITGDQDKLNRTTLIVRVAPSTEYTPLKLSECSDMSVFFSKAIGVWNLEEQDVSKIKVVFKWKHVDDPMRVMVMNQSQVCFAHMLDEIEDAPIWSEEKRRCMLDVEIVMKHPTDD